MRAGFGIWKEKSITGISKGSIQKLLRNILRGLTLTKASVLCSEIILNDMPLSKIQYTVIELLASSPLRSRFYWTGGTLLSEKYLHHRKSYDVDLFTDEPFNYEEIAPLVQEIKKKLRLKSIEEKNVFDRWEFFIHNHCEVRFEFAHYQFPRLRPRPQWKGVSVDSLDDLAANKTMALVDRHEPKDAVDVYFLIVKAKFTLKRLLKLAEKKFGLQMDESTFLSETLRGAERAKEIQPMLNGTARQQEKLLLEIQEYFSDLSAEFLRRRLSRL